MIKTKLDINVFMTCIKFAGIYMIDTLYTQENTVNLSDLRNYNIKECRRLNANAGEVNAA